MEVENTAVGGSLHISTDVIAKIARMAALEVEGVHSVNVAATGQKVKNLLEKANLQRPVCVVLQDGVAQIQLSVVLLYGCKVHPVCTRVQASVKSAVQSMTGITVSKVDIIVCGLEEEKEE